MNRRTEVTTNEFNKEYSEQWATTQSTTLQLYLYHFFVLKASRRQEHLLKRAS